jgi:hypothetical protein
MPTVSRRSLFPWCPVPSSVMSTVWRRFPSAMLGLGALLGLGWLGLRVRPAALTAGVPAGCIVNAVPLPAGLPAPVDRFYRQGYSSSVPMVNSAVIVGRGWVRLLGLRWPMRFRCVHEAGRAFTSHIEVTMFGVPVMNVDESLVDGHGQMRTPFGEQSSDPRLDQGSELRLWAESATWLPPILVTDPRVRWSPVDDATALLHVPSGPDGETFVARFDPVTGWLCLLEAMRFRGTEDGKTLWLCTAQDWAPVSGQQVARTGTLTWQDQGAPWASFTVETVTYNANSE